MIELQSGIENREEDFSAVRKTLEALQFTLGGNWDYEHGSFDRALDGEDKVWLRLPFRVIGGTLDSEQEERDVTIRFGRPYVLKHLYREGTDPTAEKEIYGGLIDQFQVPTDPDAEVEPEWAEKAKQTLSEVEGAL